MNKKKILFLSLTPLFIITIIITTYIISIKYYKYYGQYHKDAQCVYKLPDNFVLLNEVCEDTNGKLTYMLWPHNISFQDADNIGIYTTLYSNSDDIVKYKNEYYINEFIYEDLVHDTNIIAEQRNRIYNIGNPVILRGYEVIPWVIVIDSVETEIIGKFMINTIAFSINPNVSEFETLKIFDHIETEKGTIINDFIFINENAVQIKIPIDEKINMLILKSPDNNNFINCVRKISIEIP